MIFAERSLTVRGTSTSTPIPIKVFIPVAESEKAWSCRYEIGWPDGTRESAAWGVDAIQALHLALQKIGTELYMSPYHRTGQLVWDKPGAGYGFPVPKNARDLLVGDDARFEG